MEKYMLELNQEQIDELEHLLFYQIREADENIKKYTKIVASYLTDVTYSNDSVTLHQANNCLRLFGQKFETYNILWEKFKPFRSDI